MARQCGKARARYRKRWAKALAKLRAKRRRRLPPARRPRILTPGRALVDSAFTHRADRPQICVAGGMPRERARKIRVWTSAQGAGCVAGLRRRFGSRVEAAAKCEVQIDALDQLLGAYAQQRNARCIEGELLLLHGAKVA